MTYFSLESNTLYIFFSSLGLSQKIYRVQVILFLRLVAISIPTQFRLVKFGSMPTQVT